MSDQTGDLPAPGLSGVRRGTERLGDGTLHDEIAFVSRRTHPDDEETQDEPDQGSEGEEREHCVAISTPAGEINSSTVIVEISRRVSEGRVAKTNAAGRRVAGPGRVTGVGR